MRTIFNQRLMCTPESRKQNSPGLQPWERNCVAVIYFLLPLSGCTRVGSYAPSLDVYGSYFPAWLICLIVGVILTVLASQIGRVLDLSQLRKFGPLVPISLILIFSIATWFLFFAS
jgi:hypothetical protein